MDLSEHIAEYAAEHVGNWQKFDCFVWSGRPDDADQWAIFNISHRDSDVVSRSNARVIAKALEPFGDDVSEERHGHWVVGHVNATCIRVYDSEGNVTKAFAALAEIMIGLDDYPVADESDLCELESDDESESWDNYGASDFRSCLVKLAPHHYNLFRDVDSDVLFTVWHTIADTYLGGEACIHGNSGVSFTFDTLFGKRAGACSVDWATVRPTLINAIHNYRSFVASEV